MKDHQVAVITGAARGLGLAHAQRFAAADFNVILADIDAQALAAAVETLQGSGSAGWPVDVRDAAAVSSFFARVESEYGRLDVLVNNAGTSAPAPALEITDAAWGALLDIHLAGTFRCCRAAHPLLCQAGGAIVNTSSVAGILGFANRASYAAAKAGISGLTRALAIEWASSAIRVNAVAPGPFLTELVQSNIDEGDSSLDDMTSAVPLGRLGQVAELAEVVFFLATHATYVTGQTIPVDGGLTIAPSW